MNATVGVPYESPLAMVWFEHVTHGELGNRQWPRFPAATTSPSPRPRSLPNLMSRPQPFGIRHTAVIVMARGGEAQGLAADWHGPMRPIQGM